MEKTTFKDTNAYIAAQPTEIQYRLQQLRETIRKAAPDAEEVISYQMPAFRLNGMLVYFAGWKNHIGFYPVSSAVAAFKEELSPYKFAKGSIQFPHDKTLPLKLITKIVKFRVQENLNKVKPPARKKNA